MSRPSANQAPVSRDAGGLYLLFSLDQDRYALSVHEVVEVLPLRRLKAFPQAPAWVAGGFEHRGALVPVLDLLVRACGRPAAALTSTRLVLVHYRPANRVLGLILEKATDTLRLPASAFVILVWGRVMRLTWGPYRIPRKGCCSALMLPVCCLRMSARCCSLIWTPQHDCSGGAPA